MTLPATSKAIVQTGTRALELRELPLPKSISPDEGLLKLFFAMHLGNGFEMDLRDTNVKGLATAFEE